MPTIDRNDGRGLASDRPTLSPPRAPLTERGDTSRGATVDRATMPEQRTPLTERGDITRAVISEPRNLSSRAGLSERSAPTYSTDGSTLAPRLISPARQALNERANSMRTLSPSSPSNVDDMPFGKALTNAFYSSDTSASGGYRTGGDVPIAVVAGDGASGGNSSGIMILLVAGAVVAGYFIYKRYKQ